MTQTSAQHSSTTTVTWGYCAIDCPGRCPLRFHVKDGHVVRVDNGSDVLAPDPHTGRVPRACGRGLSLGEWAEAPDRLSWPLKRVGPRGSGEFKRIGWDEAIETAASELERVIGAYGNEAVYINYSTGAWATTAKPFQRLLNLLGGKLGRYNNYSNPQINCAARYTYGSAGQGSSLSQMAHADVVVAFGLNAVETRQGGATEQFAWQRELAHVGKAYLVDCRLTDSAAAPNVEWVPIKPGTDAALVAGIAYELREAGALDRAFLSTYCKGFDEETMPPRFRGKNLSYEAYLTGTGYDRTPKTPEWAAAITGVAAGKIREMAHAVAQARTLYVTQGWGVQRRSNGEYAARAIMLLPCLVGQVGLPGTNNGERESSWSLVSYGLPTGASRVKASIPAYLFTDAIDDPASLTARNAGVRGAEQLHVGIKYLINYAGNCLTNQHGDINRTRRILADETKCEFILGMDVALTDSMRYADIVLPDLFRFEQWSQASSGFDDFATICTGSPAPTARYERKTCYEACELMAKRLGVEDAFSEGKSELDWAREAYGRTRAHIDGLPPWDEAVARGVVSVPVGSHVALADFRRNPALHPLATPSGKIEIFSERLLDETASWEVAPDDTLPGMRTYPAIPVYVAEWEGAQTVDARYPLQLTGFHFSGRVHSSWGAVESRGELFPQVLWMNLRDTRDVGAQDGAVVRVVNEHGQTQLPCFVTERIMPGVVAMPQGAWAKPAFDEKGRPLDLGGSLNVLTGHRANPLSKGNPQHTMVCRVEVAKGPLESASGNAGAVAATGSSVAPGEAEPDFAAIKGAHPGRIVFDPALCTGCKTCVAACRARFKGVFCSVKPHVEGTYPALSLSFEGAFCGRCARPVCVSSCPTQALSVNGQAQGS